MPSSMPRGRITVSYRVRLDHEDHDWSSVVDGAAYWRQWCVFYTARSLFILNGEESENITVKLRLPDQWRVTAPWQKQDGYTTLFIVPGHDARIFRIENRRSSGSRQELFLYNTPMPAFFEELKRRKYPRLQQIVDLFPQ